MTYFQIKSELVNVPAMNDKEREGGNTQLGFNTAGDNGNLRLRKSLS